LKGIDTNVLIRYLIQDEPEQARRASRFIATACSADDPGFINRIVLCELVWVLESAYGYARDRMAQLIENLLRTAQLKVEDHDVAWAALREYQTGADFADALIAALNQRVGCEDTVTFDRKAGRRPGFFAL
jgi:predicted nucleic-acid-binding protein